MNKILLDLDDSIRLLVLKNETIIMLEEYDYSHETLNELYTKMITLSVEEVVVITHNVWSSCAYAGSCIALEFEELIKTPLSNVSKQDITKIIDIANKAGIEKVHFIEKIGYFIMFGTPNVCYVESARGMKHLICVNGCIEDFCVSTQSSLKKNIDRFCQSNNLTEVVNENELYSTNALMAFTNAASMLTDEKLVYYLSVFAYALLADSTYRYDASVIKREVVATPIAIAVDSKAEESDDSTAYDDGSGPSMRGVDKKSRKGEKSSSSKQSRRNKNNRGVAEKDRASDDDLTLPNDGIIDADLLRERKFVKEVPIKKSKATKVMAAIMVLMLFAAGGSFGYFYFVACNWVKDSRVAISQYTTQIEALSKLNSDYQYFLDEDTSKYYSVFNKVMPLVSSLQYDVKQLHSSESGQYLVIGIMNDGVNDGVDAFLASLHDEGLKTELLNVSEVTTVGTQTSTEQGGEGEAPIAKEILLKVKLD